MEDQHLSSSFHDSTEVSRDLLAEASRVPPKLPLAHSSSFDPLKSASALQLDSSSATRPNPWTHTSHIEKGIEVLPAGASKHHEILRKDRSKSGHAQPVHISKATRPSAPPSSGPLQPTILVLGCTGAGKSSFISNFVQRQVIVGEGLRSCTSECSSWESDIDPYGTVRLIDSPGFGDTARPDLDILQAIADWVVPLSSPHITAILYLHRITDQRMTGTGKTTLQVLSAFAGQAWYPYITIVTTMWDTLARDVDHTRFDKREIDLTYTPVGWGDLTSRGARTFRYLGTRDSAKGIISSVAGSQPTEPPRFLLQLSNGERIEDTAPGLVITAELRRREERQRLEEEKECAELEEEARVKQAELAAQQSRARQQATSPRGSESSHRSEMYRARPHSGGMLTTMRNGPDFMRVPLDGSSYPAPVDRPPRPGLLDRAEEAFNRNLDRLEEFAHGSKGSRREKHHR